MHSTADGQRGHTPYGEAIIADLLSRHVVKPLSKYSCLYPQTSTNLSLNREALLVSGQ